MLDPTALRDLRHRFTNIATIEYTFYQENLGSAAGHNRLLANAEGDLLMTANPDILVAPRMYLELIEALARAGSRTRREARQLPVEHLGNSQTTRKPARRAGARPPA